jgi:hypothetical protein
MRATPGLVSGLSGVVHSLRQSQATRPYPSVRHYVPPTAFAVARLARLAPGGRWVLFTEAARYATLLKAVGDYDESVQRRFRVGLSSLPPELAPPSAIPRLAPASD